MDIETVKEQICDVCHKMWQLGWVAANDGNVSVKLDDGTILATPTGMSKSFITPEKLIRFDSQGNVLEAAEGLARQAKLKCIYAAMRRETMLEACFMPIRPEQRDLRLQIRPWICII